MQKKISLYIFVVLAAIALTISSCSFESSDNGRLDGAWHLLLINEETAPDANIYWSFQNNLLELRDKGGDKGAFLLRFSHEDQQLFLSQPHIFDRDNGDKPLEDAAFLMPFGIDNLNETFQIVNLTRSRMTLKSETKKLEFRKF